MISSILKIDFDDMSEAIPAFICLIAMPLPIVYLGIAFGIISYVVINLITGKVKEKNQCCYVYISNSIYTKNIFM